MRRLIVAVGALGAGPAATALAWWTVSALRGVNRSDVGVPMYESAGAAFAAGVATYIIVGVTLLWLLVRKLGRGGHLALAAGAIWLVLCFVAYAIGAAFH